MELRIAKPEELPAIAKLETCFAFPLSEQELRSLSQNELFRILLWADGTQILGHCILYRVLDEAEITSFAIDEIYRGQGYGTAFLDTLLQALRQDGAKIAYLEVRESNAAARRVYQKCGFTEIGRRKRFYQKPTEDAIAMGIEL